jgi:hypothetical protein
MKIIGNWLSANRYEPIRYKYDHSDHDVLVTVDFPGEAAANAFAARFGGCPPLTRPTCLTGQLSPMREI